MPKIAFSPAANTRAPSNTSTLALAVAFLGGRRVFGRAVQSKLDVHDAIEQGLSATALVHLQRNVETLKPVDIGQVIGMGAHAMQQRAQRLDAQLSREQGSRAWKFEEILTTATETFGSQSEAERWLSTPAMALNQRRPIDLLASSAGTELVEELLGRLRYGVFTRSRCRRKWTTSGR